MALYQKARPITFAQVIGQDHVTDVLVAAIAKNRIGHAYLFSGPRGVGKTTSARLLAMAVNCERKDSIKDSIKDSMDAPPCGTCESCRLVQAGNHPDVIELDAASNNSVEDVRDLREKVRLASIRGGKRVWILDEAHMLSKAAANALLKTLEEPPANLIFILATTEPERLPPTILSRCQHYRFRRLSEEEIASKLEQLAKNAQVEVQPEAMKLMARAADGAMRDGESLLERLLSTGNAITVEVAEDALGLPPQGRMEELATALAKDDVGLMLQLAGNLYQAGFAPRSLAERLQITLRDALYAAVGVAGYSFTVALEQAELLRAIHALDDGMEAFVRHDDLLSLESILIKTRNTICKNVPSDAAFQAAPVQVMQPQAAQQAAPTLPDFNPTGARTATSVPKEGRRDARASRPSQPTAAPRASTPVKAINWHDVQRKANGKLKAFMRPAQAEVEGNHLTLTFAKKSNFHYERLLEHRHELEALLQQHYGEQALLTIVSPEGKRTHSQRPSSGTVSNISANHHAAVPSVQQPSAPVTTSSEVKTTATEHKPIPQPTTVKPAAEATASQPRANNKPPELQQVERQEKKQASAVKAPPTSKKTKATSANEMGYSSVQYSGEEELPPDFWDSPPVARKPVAREQTETQQPKKISVDTTETGSLEESLPPDFWDSPVETKKQATQAEPAARKILSAAASTSKGIALADVLRHFPGRVTEEIIEEVEEVEEEQEASMVEKDDAVISLEKTSAVSEVEVEAEKENMSVKGGEGLLEPIASSDALTDIEALSPLADGVTAGEGLLELNSATATDRTQNKTPTTPEASSKEISSQGAAEEVATELSEENKEEATEKDVPKKKKSHYAQSLF